ncbi:MAG: primosomal protein N', partial [Chloroflexi bacterium]|nr:primosomal protein N' [Chloroflexota bacterium]
MPTFVEIAVNIPAVSGVFDYHLPPDLEGLVGAGCLVTAPFGARTVQGVVLRFVEQPSVAETKAVIALLDPQPVLTAAQIALAEAMAGATLNPLAAMVGLMLPPGLSQQADTRYELRTAESGQPPAADLSRTQARLVDLLKKRGPLRGRQIDRHFKHVDWRKSAQALVRRGLLGSQPILPAPRVRPKFVRTAQLAVPPEQAEAALPALGKKETTQKRRAAALRFLMRTPEAVDVSWVYAESGCNLADLQILAERGLIVLRETEIWRDPVEGMEQWEDLGNLTLTAAQKEALKAILAAFDDPSAERSRPFLLHGVTGSGKTEMYIRAAQEAIRRGKQALILVPEIALTPQTVRRFLARFPGQVGLVHSKLSAGERYDTWRRARAGLLKVVIGPRSALFTPLPDVGLIVVDECHDGSYHQSEPPFYDAAAAAQTYARLGGAVCIFGSATPPIPYRYQAEALTPTPLPEGEGQKGRGMRLLELPGRITTSRTDDSAQSLELPPIDVIDMRAELKAGNRAIFSRTLSEALAQTLARGEQAILFLNRRGTATYVFCRECGYTLKCPRCDTPLTYHVQGLKVESSRLEPADPQPATFKLVCHRCGYTRQMPKKCPDCGGRQIRQYGLGSERVEAEVARLFPGARTLRWDWETTRRKDAHEIILSHFAAHRADVLVGTQMLAKGLDLPLVTLVGVVLADVGLNLPDPFA